MPEGTPNNSSLVGRTAAGSSTSVHDAPPSSVYASPTSPPSGAVPIQIRPEPGWWIASAADASAGTRNGLIVQSRRSTTRGRNRVPGSGVERDGVGRGKQRERLVGRGQRGRLVLPREGAALTGHRVDQPCGWRRRRILRRRYRRRGHEVVGRRAPRATSVVSAYPAGRSALRQQSADPVTYAQPADPSQPARDSGS